MRQLTFVLLWILIFVIPWEGIFAIPGLTTASKVLGVLAFGSGLAGALLSGKFRFPLALIWPGLFSAWCAVSIQWAPSSEMALGRAQTYVLLLTLVWLICQFADTPKRLKWLMRAFVLGIALIVSNMYFGYLHAGVPVNNWDLVRYTADATDANGFALFCNLGILFSFYLIRRREKTGFELPDFFYWGFIVAAGLAIPMSGSRTGILTGAIVGFVLLGMLKNLTWYARLGLVVSALFVAILVSQLLRSTTVARFSEGFGSYSFWERYDAWVSGIEAWTETPFLGVGAGSYYEITRVRGPRPMVAHNTFVGVLVESGVIGFVFYYAFWAIIFWRVMQFSSVDRYFWLSVFATFLPILVVGQHGVPQGLVVAWRICPLPDATAKRSRGKAARDRSVHGAGAIVESAQPRAVVGQRAAMKLLFAER